MHGFDKLKRWEKLLFLLMMIVGDFCQWLKSKLSKVQTPEAKE